MKLKNSENLVLCGMHMQQIHKIISSKIVICENEDSET